MDFELVTLAARLQTATVVEIFGELKGSPADMMESAKTIYKKCAKIAYPDRYSTLAEKEVATEAFKKLSGLWLQAQAKITNGTYGQDDNQQEPVVISTRKHKYVVRDQIASGSTANIFRCTYNDTGADGDGIIKIAQDAKDNGFLVNEAKVLREILADQDSKRQLVYVPTVIESFVYKDSDDPAPRQANVFAAVSNVYSLEEVMSEYPEGVPPKHVAWIWRRLLVALHLAHSNRIIHGAVLPSHILIHPEHHGLVLIDWTAAVFDPAKTGERISTVSTKYESLYPPEVFDRKSPLPGIDIFMGAKCMTLLLGGDPQKNSFPSAVPRSLQAFFKGCMLLDPRIRPNNAFNILIEFTELIETLWGKRKFIAFEMPKKSAT